MDHSIRLLDDHVGDRVWSYLFPSDPALRSKTLITALATKLAPIGAHDPSTTTSTGYSAYSYPLSEYPLQFGSLFPRDSIARQALTLLVIMSMGSYLLYFSTSTLSYYVLFDRRLEHHPRFLKNQVRREISLSSKVIPVIAALIVPWFIAEIRGHTYHYDHVSDYSGFLGLDRLLPRFTDASRHPWLAASGGLGGWVYMAFSTVIFLLFTDYCIYWIHRWLHLPFLYKRLHKPHHKWLVPTPFASLAFHPLDGYAQSLPYHFIPYLLPMQKWLYLGLFVVVNIWTIVIHDGDMISGHFLESYINSPAHHTLHHLYFTCNYGQYFTWADSWGGSYRPPRPDLDPIHDALKNMEKKRLVAERESASTSATLSSSAGASASGFASTSTALKSAVPVSSQGDNDSDSGYGSDTKEDEHIRQHKSIQDKDVRRRR